VRVQPATPAAPRPQLIHPFSSHRLSQPSPSLRSSSILAFLDNSPSRSLVLVSVLVSTSEYWSIPQFRPGLRQSGLRPPPPLSRCFPQLNLHHRPQLLTTAAGLCNRSCSKRLCHPDLAADQALQLAGRCLLSTKSSPTKPDFVSRRLSSKKTDHTA
jgi:hypothetical protein